MIWWIVESVDLVKISAHTMTTHLVKLADRDEGRVNGRVSAAHTRVDKSSASTPSGSSLSAHCLPQPRDALLEALP